MEDARASMHSFTRLVLALPIRTQPGAARLPFVLNFFSTSTVAQCFVAQAFVALYGRPRFTRRVQNVQTVLVAAEWICVHSVANSEGTERSRTCFKAEEQ